MGTTGVILRCVPVARIRVSPVNKQIDFHENQVRNMGFIFGRRRHVHNKVAVQNSETFSKQYSKRCITASNQGKKHNISSNYRRGHAETALAFILNGSRRWINVTI
jgi:hypothetical protein